MGKTKPSKTNCRTHFKTGSEPELSTYLQMKSVLQLETAGTSDLSTSDNS